MVSHSSFDVQFSDALVMLTIFSCAYWPLIYLLWRSVYLSPLLIFESGLLLRNRSSLYFLDVNLLLDLWFENVLPHSVSCLFIVYSVLSCTKVFFFFSGSSLCLFFLYFSVSLVSFLRNHCQIRCHEELPLYFLLRVLQLLSLHLNLWSLFS